VIFKERYRLNIQALIVDAFSDSNIFNESKNAPHYAALGFKHTTNMDANISVIYESNVNGEANDLEQPGAISTIQVPQQGDQLN
jgi:hypothetical protein